MWRSVHSASPIICFFKAQLVTQAPARASPCLLLTRSHRHLQRIQGLPGWCLTFTGIPEILKHEVFCFCLLHHPGISSSRQSPACLPVPMMIHVRCLHLGAGLATRFAVGHHRFAPRAPRPWLILHWHSDRKRVGASPHTRCRR
jgi:hypothetical protein